LLKRCYGDRQPGSPIVSFEDQRADFAGLPVHSREYNFPACGDVFGYALLKVTAAMDHVDLDFITRVVFWYYYCFAIVLGIVWLIVGLSPRIRLPERERRDRLRHLFLIGTNILGIIGFLTVLLHQRSLRYAITPNQIPYASELDHQPINVAMAIMLICAPMGLYMVWSSRQRPEPD
jgi:hypothetical protein